jgi:hypothetical protein
MDERAVLIPPPRSAILFFLAFFVSYVLAVNAVDWPQVLSPVLGIFVVFIWMMQAALVAWTTTHLNSCQITAIEMQQPADK